MTALSTEPAFVILSTLLVILSFAPDLTAAESPFPAAVLKSLKMIDLPSSGPHWQVDASQVQIRLEKGEQIADLKDLKIRLFDDKDLDFLISAEKGVFNLDAALMEAQGRILVTTPLKNRLGKEVAGSETDGRLILKGGKIVADLKEQRVEVIGGITTEQQATEGRVFSVSARRGTLFFKTRQMHYFEDVRASLGDTLSESEEMRIQLDKETYSIAQAVAVGKVKIQSVSSEGGATPKLLARCGQAIFLPADIYESASLRPTGESFGGRVILEGSPFVLMNGDRMEGERISLWLSSQKVLVEKAKAKIKPDFRNGEKNG